MLMGRHRILLAGASILLLGAVGCGGTKVYPVRGKVTFEGKQLKGGGSIAFMPTGKQDGKAAGGEIAEDGTYILMTHKPGDGSMAGEFRVVITQVVEREPDSTRDGEKAGKAVSVVTKEDRIPAVYGDAYNSPLTAKVEAKDNQIDFDLKRNVPGANGTPGWGAMADPRVLKDVARIDREPFGGDGVFRLFGPGHVIR
jgi:hypothetical protein